MVQMIEALVHDGLAKPNEVLLVNLEEPIFLELLQRGEETQVLELAYDVFRKAQTPASKPWLFLDEVQNIPGWARWVRAAAETGRARFVVSGSSSRLLEPDLASVLTGRHLSLTLWPLSLAEYIQFRDREKEPRLKLDLARIRLQEYLERGGMPRAVLELDDSAARAILKQYFRDILHRDVVSRHKIRDATALEKVAHFYLVNSAQLSSLNAIKNRYQLAMDQVRNYTSHLAECYLIGQVPRFSFKTAEQDRSPKKTYARDTGLRNAVSFRFSPERGPLAETAVYNHLCRDPERRIYYFQEKGTPAECDFVVWKGQQAEMAIQVCCCKGDLPEREKKGLLAAMDVLKLQEGLLLTNTAEKKVTPLGRQRRIKEQPLSEWLLTPQGE